MGGRSMAWWRWGNFKLELTGGTLMAAGRAVQMLQKGHCRDHYL